MTSNGLPHNVIRGSTQNAEINMPLEADDQGEDAESEFIGNKGSREQEWAQELRKADERSHEVRMRCEDLKKQNQDLESKIRVLEESLETRDVEILRLGSLYQGG